MQQYREYRISPVPEYLVPVPVFPLQAAYTIMQQLAGCVGPLGLMLVGCPGRYTPATHTNQQQRRLATSSALGRISLTGRPPAFQPLFYLLMIGKLRFAALKPLHGLLNGHYLPRLFFNVPLYCMGHQLGPGTVHCLGYRSKALQGLGI